MYICINMYDNVSVVIEGSSDTKKMIDIESNYLVYIYVCMHVCGSIIVYMYVYI
jgi:hypothetical protein